MAVNVNKLVSLEEAQGLALAAAVPLATEKVQLENASGRVLAEEVRALRDEPPSTQAAMDGYAVHSEDVNAASSEKERFSSRGRNSWSRPANRSTVKAKRGDTGHDGSHLARRSRRGGTPRDDRDCCRGSSGKGACGVGRLPDSCWGRASDGSAPSLRLHGPGSPGN